MFCIYDLFRISIFEFRISVAQEETCLTTATATVKRAAYDLPLVGRAADEPPGTRHSETSISPGAGSAADGPLLLHHAQWFCKLRWLVVAAMLALALVAAVAGPWLSQPRYSA